MEQKNLVIRRETPADYAAVEHLTREAFWNVYRPGCTEHYVLHVLRQLFPDDTSDTLVGFAVKQTPQIIPASIFRDQFQERLHHHVALIDQVSEDHAEQSAFSHTSANISGKEQPLQSQLRILLKCRIEFSDNGLFVCAAQTGG